MTAKLAGAFDGDGMAAILDEVVVASAKVGQLAGALGFDEGILVGGEDEGRGLDPGGEVGDVGKANESLEEESGPLEAIAVHGGLNDIVQEGFVGIQEVGPQNGGQGGPGEGAHAAISQEGVPGTDDGSGEGGGLGGGAAEDEAAQALGVMDGEAQGDAGAVAKPGEVDPRKVQFIEDGRQIVGVLAEGGDLVGVVGLALATGVVGQDGALRFDSPDVASPVASGLGHAVEKDQWRFSLVGAVIFKMEGQSVVGADGAHGWNRC